jgi:hypothetical protein
LRLGVRPLLSVAALDLHPHPTTMRACLMVVQIGMKCNGAMLFGRVKHER